MASSKCSGLSPSMMTPRSVSSFQAPWLMSRTITFIPKLIAAFCVLRRVRRLELKKIIINVLFRPNSTYLKRSFLISNASARADFKSPMSCTQVNFFILSIINRYYPICCLRFINPDSCLMPCGHRFVLPSGLPVSFNHPFVGSDFFQSHRTTGMQLLGTDADFST